MFEPKSLSQLVTIGLKYEQYPCWELLRFAFRGLRGIELPRNPYRAMAAFRTLAPGETPQEWDVIVIRNHPFVTNHVGIMLNATQFVHSMEDVNVTIGFVERAPWNEPKRIAGYMRLREER